MDTPVTQQNTGGLDPTVVALTKAIGKAESGGKYDAGDNTGDNANSYGAYQMTPGFLQEWAPKSGIQYQPGMKLNPAQQDEIAYNAVKTMGTTGDPNHPHLGKLTPAQITSAWNTGDPNAYLDSEYGKNNTYGSTENYVNKVSDYYKEYSGQTGQENNQPTQQTKTDNSQPDWLTALEGLGAGTIRWLVSHLGTAAKVALPIGGMALGGVIGSAIGPEGTIAGGLTGKTIGELAGNAIGGEIAKNVGGDNQTPTGGTTSVSNEEQPQQQINQDFQQSTQASSKIKDAITQAMQGTQSNRVFSQSQPGQDAINTASMFGLIKPDEEGNMYFDEEKRQKAMQEIANLDDKIIESNGGTNNASQVMNHATNFINSDKFSTPLDRQKAEKIARDEMMARGMADEQGNINKEVSLSDLRTAQKEHYAASKGGWNSGKTSHEIMAHKALGMAYGKAIREKLQDPTLHDKVMKMEQNLINVKHLNKRLSGKKAPRNKGLMESFLRQGARAAEIYIGDKLGGPIGAIIGGVVGEHFNQKIEKKYGRNIFETPDMKAALDILHDTKPKEYTQLVDALKSHGVELKEQEISKTDSDPINVDLQEAQKNPSMQNIDEVVNENIKGLTTRQRMSSSFKEINKGFKEEKKKRINLGKKGLIELPKI